MGLRKKGLVGLQREGRQAVVWREREEREGRVAEAVAIIGLGSVRARARASEMGDLSPSLSWVRKDDDDDDDDGVACTL